jgi:hypothetical protein
LNFCLQHAVAPKNTRQLFAPGVETESLRAQLIGQEFSLQRLRLVVYCGGDLDLLTA